MKQSTIIRLNGMAYLLMLAFGIGLVGLSFICPHEIRLPKIARWGLFFWGIGNMFDGSRCFMNLLLEITGRKEEKKD